MELLIIAALFVALAVLAPRFGADSRDRARIPEEDLAALGLAWDGSPTDARPATVAPVPAASRPSTAGRLVQEPASSGR